MANICILIILQGGLVMLLLEHQTCDWDVVVFVGSTRGYTILHNLNFSHVLYLANFVTLASSQN